MSMETSIQDLVSEWLRLDRDPDTKGEISQLWKDQNSAELELRLRHRIQFGTAGLRAAMAAGFSRMNSLTVIQASQGLAAYVLNNVENCKKRGIVIGRDARHNSDKFARLAAAAFVEKGIKVWWYEQPVHTPLVPFGVRELNAAAGVMVTASHNPANDNGYKVYWENGCQIIPPHDTGIADEVDKNLEPLSWDINATISSLLVESIALQIRDRYNEAIFDVLRSANLEPLLAEYPNDLKFSYTALHGVGLRPMEEMLAKLGLSQHMHIVQEQAHPDPDFPSLRFPNPEEKGALDVAIWSADRHGASFILATDPDADRFSAAEKVDGQWHQFSGNEIGVLMGAYIHHLYRHDKSLAMLASTVSSAMLGKIAQKVGFYYEETLTGFKWMSNRAMALREQGYEPRFAFEESIGYMLPRVVSDKDGIATAALFIVMMAAWKKERGLTPYAALQELYKKYGHFEDAPTYLISPNPEVTRKVFDSIRVRGEPYPKKLGNHTIRYWRDLTRGYDSSTADHKPTLPVDASSQMLTFELKNESMLSGSGVGVKATIRASGTEPKIKVYVEGHAHKRESAKKAAEETLGLILAEWLRPGENGLRRAEEL